MVSAAAGLGAGVAAFVLAAIGFSFGLVYMTDRPAALEDRASEVIFHMENHRSLQGTFNCSGSGSKVYFGSTVWNRFPTNNGVVHDSAAGAWDFNITHAGFYKSELTLFTATLATTYYTAESRDVPYFQIRREDSGGDEILAMGTYDNMVPTSIQSDGSVNIIANRILPANSQIFIYGVCDHVDTVIEGGSFTIRRNAWVSGRGDPVATPAPTPAPTPA